MPRKPTGMPNGRPPKIINAEQFEALCKIQCTEVEICSVLNCDETTLNKWCRETYGLSFSQVFKEKKLGGRASLRRMQWKLAGKNATMSIWLGKQYLNQTDKVEVEQAEQDRNITVEMVIPTDDDVKRLKSIKESLFKQ